MHTTTFAYDSHGNLTALTDPTNWQVTVTYNGQGQQLTVTAPSRYDAGDVCSGRFDDGGRPCGQCRYSGDRQVRRILRRTNPLVQQTQYPYDTLNRLTQLSDPFGQMTTFTSDGNDGVLTLADARNGVTQYTYDSTNRIANRNDSLLRQEGFQYDGKDNLTQRLIIRGK